MAERKQVDWEGVERDYLQGCLVCVRLVKYGAMRVHNEKAKKRMGERFGAKNAKAKKLRNEFWHPKSAPKKHTEKKLLINHANCLVNVKLVAIAAIIYS